MIKLSYLLILFIIINREMSEAVASINIVKSISGFFSTVFHSICINIDIV